MSDLTFNYPRIVIDVSNPTQALKDLTYIIEILQTEIVKAVNSKQDEDGELNIKYYNQAAEPTLSANENAAFWEDSDGGPAYYLLLKNSSGSQVKVALT